MWGFLWCLKQTCTPSHSCELSFGFTLLILTPAGLPAKKVQQQMLQFPSLLEAGVASGMSCCGKGSSLKRAFPHPIHELVFCSDFLSLLPLPSVISQPCPSRSLASLNPHAQSAQLQLQTPIAFLSSLTVSGLWLCPVTAHTAKYHPLPTLACSINASWHLVVPFETPLHLMCLVSFAILTTCSNELQLTIVIADEHTHSLEVLLSASSDRWF